MSKKAINLALIGAGKWGQNYIKSCKTLPGIKIKYVVRHTGSLKVNDLLKKDGIDGFIVATPTKTHFEIAKILIEKDKNVLIEKPAVDSSRLTKSLLELSKKHSKSRVLVGHIYLFNPAYQELKNSLDKIGKLKRLSFCGLGSPTRKDTNIFWDWGPHPIYMFLDLIGKEPKVVSSRAIKPDGAEILLDFRGIPAQIRIGWTYPKKVRQLTVEGSIGTLELSSVESKYTPLQNEILHFAEIIRGNKNPQADLQQAFAVSKIIEKSISLLKTDA